jgi:hypothetical protein
MGLSLMNMLALVKCTYRTYSKLLKILAFALYTSPLPVQALQSRSCLSYVIFLIGILWNGVQFGPLGTAATNKPIVSAPGDYGDGEI